MTRAIKKQGIINSCRQHQIPVAILNPSTLTHDLVNLDKELFLANQSLAIPISDISRLYQLPICDCAFANKKLVINVRIPITQINRSWELYELITVPFAWENQTCIIRHDTIFLAVSKTETSQNNIRQISGIGLHHCKPYHDKLCYIPRFAADPVQGPACAKKLYNGATVNEINHHCPMSCHKSTTSTISEIREETYIIAHPKNPTFICCPGKNISFPVHSYNNPGSVKISLPCNCKLVMQGEELIPNRFPCLDTMPHEATITHIIPAAWSTLKSFILHPKHQDFTPRFKNFSECLNNNWTLTIPHLNLTSTSDTIKQVLDHLKDNTIPQVIPYTIQRNSLFLVWNTLLSIGLIYVIFKNQNIATLYGLVRPTRAENDSQLHHDILFGTLCTVLIISLLAFTIKCCLIRLKKKETVSDRKQEEEAQLNVEVGETTYRGGGKHRCSLEFSEELTSLKEGQKINCILHIG